MTSIRTELPIATEPWERARSLFLEQLNHHERTLFERADLDTIYHDASVSHKQHQRSSKLQAARRRLAPLVDAIDGYGKGLDVMSNTPVAAAFLCPIWGSIRVALYIAQETEKYFEKLAKMLEKIGRTLPLFRDYQSLFQNHERLLQVLSEAYLNVLRFCTDVTALFKEAKTQAVSFVSLTVSCKILWKPFTLRFAEYLKNFEDLKQQVQDEANVAHMVESKRERELQERNRALAETRLREEKLRQTLHRFSPIDYHLTHQRLRSECHQGTAQWIFDHDSYKLWIESTESSSVHCTGIPGSGKSILASSVVDNLTVDPVDPVDPSHLICFYYCDYADHQTLNPAVILGTFIRQILEGPYHADELREWVLNQWGNRTSKPLIKELFPAIIDAFECFESVTIVIDALDELSLQDQHESGSIISAFLSLQTCRVKVFLSSRFEAIILNKVPKPSFSIALSPMVLSKDIYHFVEDIVQDKIDSKALTIQDPALQQEINTKLREGAQDMFLWVKFQIDELCEAMSDSELRETLQNLPRDLSETYRRILHRISVSIGGRKKLKLARRAFGWIICAKRTLTIEELIEAVALKEDDKTFPVNRIPTDGGKRLRLACGNLVVFDEERDSVRFAHHTVQQFLTGPDSDYGPTDGTVDFPCFLLDDAERHIYALCVSYLNFTDFETQITCCDSSTPKITETGGFIPSLMNYIRPESGTIGRLAALLKGQADSSSNLNKWSLSIQGFASRAHRENELKRKYSLLNYVSSWWCFHSPSIWDQVSEVPDDIPSELGRKTRLLCENTFPFSHRPWDNDGFGGSSQSDSVLDVPMFRWAARSGKFGLWNLMISAHFGTTALHKKNPSVRICFHDAMLYDDEQRDLLADILHGGSEPMLRLYFLVVRAHTIGPAIPAWIICRVLRLSSKSRHATLFAMLKSAGVLIARGQPEKRGLWGRGSWSNLWLDSAWSATNTSGFDDGAGTFLLEEAVKQNDADLVRCILENYVGEVHYFGPFYSSKDDSPLGRAAYGNNITMVDILFSYLDSTEWGAKIRKFDRADLDEGLRKRSLWRMKEHVEALSRSSKRFNEGNEALPRIQTLR